MEESGIRLLGLPPVLDARTVLLVLGSFPGAASLASHQYYGHPQNQFWKILQAIWTDQPTGTCASSYQNRSDWLLSKGLGMWDVYASCERKGSLDSQIRHAAVNGFARLRTLCPALQAIAHNGAESFRHASRVEAALRMCAPAGGAAAMTGVTFHRLPSTSPAHAAWSLDKKRAAWRAVLEQHGLV